MAPPDPPTSSHAEPPGQPGAEPAASSLDESLAGLPKDPPTELPTEARTELPTEPPTGALTELPTEPPTGALTELPTEPPTGALTELPMEPLEPMEPPTEPPMWSRERVVTGWAQLWNVPNLLTLLRILLIPVFWVLLMTDDGQNRSARIAATLIFLFASMTDWLDGYLARRRGLVTTFGKIADPMADKALTGVALIGLSMLGELWWWVTILIIVREVGVTVVRFVVLKHGVIPASRGGKLKTIFQMIGIAMFLWPIPAGLDVLLWTRNAVMAIAFVLTMLTGLDYVHKAYRTRSDSKADQAARARRALRTDLGGGA